MGGNEASDLAVGIAELLATDLADAGCGTVLPRPAVEEPTRARQDVVAAAKRLGATRVVSGAVDHSVSPMRVELSVYGPAGELLAGFTELERRGTFDLERALSDKLVASICLAGSAPSKSRRPLTTRPEAFLAYSRGLRLIDNPDRSGVGGAIESFKRATAIDPQFGLAYAGLAWAYLVAYQGQGDPVLAANASTAAMQAITLDPDRLRVGVTVAQVLTGLGQYDVAIDRLKKIIERSPRDDTAHGALADVFAAKADWSAAQVEYSKAVELRPAAWSNYSGLGLVQYRAGKWREAIVTYKKIIELQPGDILGYIMLGASHYALGDAAEALTQFEKANSLSPSATATGQIAAILMDQGRSAEAVRAFEQAVEMAPTQGVRQLHLGDAYERVSRVRDARAAWKRGEELAEAAARLNDKDVVALRVIALCKAKLGDLGAAARHVSNALAVAPGDPEVLIASAQIALLSGREDDALRHLAKAIENGYSPVVARKDYLLSRLSGRVEFARLTSVTP
jgi:tetratricopeptide (TPR) repeat protein